MINKIFNKFYILGNEKIIIIYIIFLILTILLTAYLVRKEIKNDNK